MYTAIFYSHSDYSDAWPIMFEQTDKHLPACKKYLFSDEATAPLERQNWTLIKYDDGLRYQQRFLHCIDQVEEEVILFHHEDMFLYSDPKYDLLLEITEAIQNNEIDIVKLICASYGPINFENTTSVSCVYENPINLKFAIQPSLCNKNKLRMIYDKTGGANIWEFEAYSSKVCDYYNIRTGMTYLPEDAKRGEYHWDSNIYPYFATAIVKGKWNFAEYENTLKPLLETHNIDFTMRGTC